MYRAELLVSYLTNQMLAKYIAQLENDEEFKLLKVENLNCKTSVRGLRDGWR